MTFSVLALTALPARGQDISNVYMLDGGAFTNALMANSLVERMDWAMVAARQSKVSDSIARPRATVPQPAALAFRPVANIDTPRVMASRYPAAKRAEAEAVFRELLSRLGGLERQYGQPSHDLATAATLVGAKLKAAGNSYLHQFLKLDPARIRFSERGMILTGRR
jgi:hypothetical protein